MFNSCQKESNLKVRGLLFIQIEFNPHFQDIFPHILSVQSSAGQLVNLLERSILSNYFLYATE